MKAYDDQTEVMTLAEVAEYLQLGERTVLRMVQRREIPGAKIASQWRFIRALIQDWLARQVTGTSFLELDGTARKETVTLPLREVIRPELMTIDLTPGPKDVVLRRLVAPLRTSGFARDTSRLLASLVTRERMMTTAVGHGVAVPHPRKPIPGMFAESAIALGVCRKGTDFDALDDKPVHLFFLICSDRDEVHLQLMAKVSWVVRQGILGRLLRVCSPEDATAVVSDAAAELERLSL